ncbi:transient receptor potential cation channel subfamily M member-like 2 isoform X2 [Apostichopus japonicus]|uniref:transient receptor potential cation channel subfamily M member-like 2 isoform X2 n=1 Tax=Stichopus japonicus TaxID=307972 RepID=UPI003AB8927D
MDQIEIQFIKSNIKRRECNTFSANPQSDICQCGKWRSSHPDENQDEWQVETHTTTHPTDAYGEIEFKGHAGRKGQENSKFVRADFKSDPGKLLELIEKHWKLKLPKLLITVTGGAKNFTLSRRLRAVFREGLIRDNTDTWILTGGLNCGVMKYVGETVRDYTIAAGGTANIAVIGIGAWGVLDQKTELIDNEGMWPATYKMDTSTDDSPELERERLDPNHTHFILVDDGTTGVFGKAIDVSGKLGKKISERNLGVENIKIPSVCLVFGGGPNTIRAVCTAIENDTPSLIIDGSGRAADREEVAERLKSTLQDLNSEDLDELKNQIMGCLAKPHLFSVYELNARQEAGGHIGKAMLDALFKATNSKVKPGLQWTLLWNRVNVDQRNLDSESWKGLDQSEIKDFVKNAITRNLYAFLELFMESGLNIKDYLAVSDLQNVFEEVKRRISLPELLVDQQQTTGEPILENFKNDTIHVHKVTPIRDLFLYAILLNRKEMSRLMWENIDEAIAAALIASHILKAMARSERVINKRESLVQHAKQYDKLAIDVLKECYDERKDCTVSFLTVNRPNWGNTNCLKLAVLAENDKFITELPAEELFTHIWLGKISEENAVWKLCLCAFCPGLCIWLIEFKNDSKDKQTTDVEERGEENDRSQEPCPIICWKKFAAFYSAPAIKFTLNLVSYLVFLILYSCIILHDFEPNMGVWDWLLLVWVGTFCIEKFRQFVGIVSFSLGHRIQLWMKDYWNIIDAVSLGTCVIGLGLDFSSSTDQIGHLLLAVDIMLFYMRLLQMFKVSKMLGPKLIMIWKMVVDLFFFVCILAVCVIGYGIALQAIMFPNESDPLENFIGVFYRPYFQIYGTLFLDTFTRDGCSDNTTLIDLGLATQCPENSGLGLVLLSLYLLLSNVMLLNLLIAMLSYTFSNVQDRADELWKIQRYDLFNEFSERPPLPPPLIIISHVYLLIRFCKRKASKQNSESSSNPYVMQKIVLWERTGLDKFVLKENQKRQENVEETTKVTDNNWLRSLPDQENCSNRMVWETSV